jgi:hypothetical protein
MIFPCMWTPFSDHAQHKCIKVDDLGSHLPLHWCNTALDSCLNCQGCADKNNLSEPVTGKDNMIVGYYVCEGFKRMEEK